MDEFNINLEHLIQHMPAELYAPFKEYVYNEFYTAKLKTSAIQLVSPNSTESQRMMNSTYADVKNYKEFLANLKEVMLIARR